ncbi:MAG: polysaccharide biosynthesis tyrosine autokinase [Bacteroidales bacterium]|jgi:capsular exopolysaccharide synthesis family protein|nr:polysaccharide biosynthesis tyrosine autokinase [Bacteroidales bacterium]
MSQTNNEQSESYEIVITDYLKILLKNWYWIALSIIICCVVAAAYILVTPKRYERALQIMIKEDTKRDISEPDEKTILKDINFILFKTNINNEIELLQSEKIMEDIVRRLRLEQRYKMRSWMKYIDLYNESPIEVAFLNAEKEKELLSLTITLLPENKLKLTNFKRGNTRISKATVIASILDTAVTPLGRIIVAPTFYYNEGFIDETIHVSKLNMDDVIEDLRKNIKITKSDDNTIIKLLYQDNSIQRADDILNTMIAIYDHDNIDYRNQVIENTSNFISDRLRIIEKGLGLVDKDISRYKSSNMINNTKESSYLFLMESSQLTQELSKLQNQLSVAKFIKDYLTNSANNNNLIPSNSGIDDLPLEKQISEYNTLMLKKGRLLENSSEKSPAVLEQIKILLAMRQSIIQSVDNLSNVYELQIAGIKEQENLTNRKISNIPEKEMDIISIERRLKIQENLYLYLLQKREENELARSFITSNFRIVNSSGGSSYPTFPNSLTIMCLALIFGFLAPCIYFFLNQLLSSKIRNAKDVIDCLEVPFLGIIPQVNHRSSKQPKIAAPDIENIVSVNNNGSDIVSEAFRIIRTNINFMSSKKEKTKVVMFTSFNEPSGKSFVSLNLAVSFAMARKKTALIDMNMRKATLSSYIHSPETGLANYLDNTDLTLQDILLKEPFFPGLDMIPVGTIPLHPVDLLMSDKLKDLISALQDVYDYIIIDTTPFNIVADASIIEKLSDLVIFVLGENLSDRRRLPELDSLYSHKINNLSVLLNGVSSFQSY